MEGEGGLTAGVRSIGIIPPAKLVEGVDIWYTSRMPHEGIAEWDVPLLFPDGVVERESPPLRGRAGERPTDLLGRPERPEGPAGAMPVSLRSFTAEKGTPRARTIPLTEDGIALLGLIEILIAQSGISEGELAKRLGIERRSLSQYRLLYRRRPSVPWLVRLVHACGGKVVVELP